MTDDSTSSLAVGDLTGDAHLDIVSARANTVAAFVYSGSRAFTARTPVLLPSVSNVAYDAGAHQIVATQRQTPGRVTRYADSGSALEPVGPAFMLQGGKPEPVVSADVNGSGNDVVVLHDDSGEVEVVRAGESIDERFPADDRASSHYDSRALAVGDIDGDGLPDVVVATAFGVSLLMHRNDALPAVYGSGLVDAVSPATRQTNISSTVHPMLTLTHAATNASSTVKLVDAHGNTVPAVDRRERHDHDHRDAVGTTRGREVRAARRRHDRRVGRPRRRLRHVVHRRTAARPDCAECDVRHRAGRLLGTCRRVDPVPCERRRLDVRVQPRQWAVHVVLVTVPDVRRSGRRAQVLRHRA